MSEPTALKKAIEANEAWSPPEPVDFAELTKDSLLPPAAYDAAADLGIDREEADAIATVFFEHMAQLGHTVEEVRADPTGAAAGFAMFWGYLAAIRMIRQRLLSTAALTAGAARLRNENSMLPWAELGPESRQIEIKAAGHVVRGALDSAQGAEA